MYIDNNKTANIKSHKLKFTMTCKVDYVYHTTKTAKTKKWYYITLHYIDIVAMLQIIITFFFIFAFLVVW